MDTNKIMEILRSNPGNRFFNGAKEEELSALERTLGIKLPPTFYQFLKQSNGALLYSTEEILGTTDTPNGERQSIQSARDALKTNTSLPDHLIPFHIGAIIHCFDTVRKLNGEYTIVKWTFNGRQMEDDSQSFAQWLENYIIRVHEQI